MVHIIWTKYQKSYFVSELYFLLLKNGKICDKKSFSSRWLLKISIYQNLFDVLPYRVLYRIEV